MMPINPLCLSFSYLFAVKFYDFRDGRLQRITEVIYQIISSMDENAVLFINYFTLVAYLLQKKAILPALGTINEVYFG